MENEKRPESLSRHTHAELTQVFDPEESIDLLKGIIDTVLYAMHSIDRIAPASSDPLFEYELYFQRNKYSTFLNEASALIKDFMHESIEHGAAEPMQISIQNTSKARYHTSKLAAVSIHCLISMIIDTTRHLNHNPHAEKSCRHLATKLLAFEESSLKTIRDFL